MVQICIIVSFRAKSIIIICQETVAVTAGNDQRSPDNIAQSDRDKIVKEHHDTDVFAKQHGQRDEIHIGDALFKAAQEEQHSREEDTADLFHKRFPGVGKPGSQVD